MQINKQNCYTALKLTEKDNVSSSMSIVKTMLDCAIELFGEEGLEDLIFNIIKSQPSMAAVINAGFKIIDAIKNGSKNELIEDRNHFSNSYANAIDKAYEHLNGINNIATISYSRSVFDLLVMLNPANVYLSIAYPAKEGELCAYNLSLKGINAVLFEDIAYSLVMKDVEAIVVGADAVFDDSFVNKVGTYYLALLSKEFSVPFYVVSCDCKYLDSRGRKFFNILPMDENEISAIECKRINKYFEHIPISYVNKMFVR